MNNSCRTLLGGIFVATTTLLWLPSASTAQIKSTTTDAVGLKLQPVAAQKAPKNGSFWSLQHSQLPPLPFNPFPDLPLYYMGRGTAYLVDDSSVDYAAIYRQREEERALLKLEWDAGLVSDTEYYVLSGSGSPIVIYNYTSADLWIELLRVQDDYAYLTLHGTIGGRSYQLLSKTNLSTPNAWEFKEIIYGASGTNQTDFTPLYVGEVTNQFFCAHQSDNIVSLTPYDSAYEPNSIFAGHDGNVRVNCYATSNLTVYYQLNGTASNGVDYTNLPGSIVIPANAGYADLWIHPFADAVVEGVETVVVTVVETNHYLVSPGTERATVLVSDSSTRLSVGLADNGFAVEADGPPGALAQSSSFYVYRQDDWGDYPPLAVNYQLTGTASNGADYPTLSGVLSFAANEQSKYVDLIPNNDSLAEGEESVIFTLVPTNTYRVNEAASSATITIADSTTMVSIVRQADAIEPNPVSGVSGKTGQFAVTRSDPRIGNTYPLTVTYNIGGTAVNGVDYTNLSGSVTLQTGQQQATVFIEPLYDNQLEGAETVTLTLTRMEDGYVVNPDFAAATNLIQDNLNSNLFQKVVTLNSAVGLDYHSPSNCLIVSGSEVFAGTTFDFIKLYANTFGTNLISATTNWSGITSLPDEVKLLTIKQTANGFTNGDMYFSSSTGIGWLSADGTRSNLNWCVLTNAFETNALPIRGGICLDQTGGWFSNELVVVTSPGTADGSVKGVWRIRPNGTNGIPTLITNIATSHLEGIITLTNDVTRWGPWAGKVITGDENTSTIFTIAPNGDVTPYNATTPISVGIKMEDADLVPPNQDLYVCSQSFNAKGVYKLSRNYLTNYVGDLMVTEAGEVPNLSAPGRLFFLHWDAATTNFLVRTIGFTLPNGYAGQFEHVTFAPLNLPTVP